MSRCDDDASLERDRALVRGALALPAPDPAAFDAVLAALSERQRGARPRAPEPGSSGTRQARGFVWRGFGATAMAAGLSLLLGWPRSAPEVRDASRITALPAAELTPSTLRSSASAGPRSRLASTHALASTVATDEGAHDVGGDEPGTCGLSVSTCNSEEAVTFASYAPSTGGVCQ